MAKRANLLDTMDEAAMALLATANPTTIEAGGQADQPQPIDLRGRIAAFEAVTAYLAVKNKLKLPDPKANGIDRYRSAINGNPSGRGARRGAQGGDESSADPDAE